MTEKSSKNVYIIFSGMSEPFLNPECGKMMKFVSDNGYQLELSSNIATDV